MGENQPDPRARLTIELVERAKAGQRDVYEEFDVLRVWQVGASNEKWISVFGEAHGGLVHKDVALHNSHFISAVTLYTEEAPYGLTEMYTLDPKDQELAFELLECTFDEFEVSRSLTKQTRKEDKVDMVIGPERLEVTLEEKFKLSRSGQANEIVVVVTDAQAPEGHFCDFSLKGRVWVDGKLPKVYTTFWSRTHKVKSITYCEAHKQSSTYSSFPMVSVIDSWKGMLNKFGKLKTWQITQIKNWEPRPKIVQADDVDDGWGSVCGYPGTHWTHAAPAHYEPKVACFRTSGDKVGVQLHREQLKAWDEREDAGVSPGDVLADLIGAEEDSDMECTAVVVVGCTKCSFQNCVDGSFCEADIDEMVGLGMGYMH